MSGSPSGTEFHNPGSTSSAAALVFVHQLAAALDWNPATTPTVLSRHFAVRGPRSEPPFGFTALVVHVSSHVPHWAPHPTKAHPTARFSARGDVSLARDVNRFAVARSRTSNRRPRDRARTCRGTVPHTPAPILLLSSRSLPPALFHTACARCVGACASGSPTPSPRRVSRRVTRLA